MKLSVLQDLKFRVGVDFSTSLSGPWVGLEACRAPVGWA